MRRKQVSASRKHGFRSGLEAVIGEQLSTEGIGAKYESLSIDYVIPASKHKYTPDWLLPNGIIIETKGRFVAADMKKHLLIKQQHPELDIRFVFQNSKAKIRKGSKTTYADWCNKHGFLFADKKVPSDWLK